MKKFLYAVFSLSLFASVAHAASAPEWSVSGLYLFPNDDETWDDAYGGELKATFWQSDEIGFTLSLGVQQWGVNEDPVVEPTYLSPNYIEAFVAMPEGDAMMYPLGLGVVYRSAVGQSATMNLEAGIKYVIVDSDVNLTGGYVGEDANNYYYSDIISADIEVDDGIVAYFGADLSFPVGGLICFIGGGYQFDISKGDVSTLGEDVGENELKGGYIQAGVRF